MHSAVVDRFTLFFRFILIFIQYTSDNLFSIYLEQLLPLCCSNNHISPLGLNKELSYLIMKAWRAARLIVQSLS